jgi:hypothetical protein
MEMKVAKSKDGQGRMFIPVTIKGYKVTEQEIINKEDDRFTMVHNRIVQSKLLSTKAKILYTVLKSFCFDTDVCYPPVTLLKEMLEGWDHKTIRKYANELSDLNIIAMVTAMKKDGKKITFYKMLPSNEWRIEGDKEVFDSWRAQQQMFEEVLGDELA